MSDHPLVTGLCFGGLGFQRDKKEGKSLSQYLATLCLTPLHFQIDFFPFEAKTSEGEKKPFLWNGILMAYGINFFVSGKSQPVHSSLVKIYLRWSDLL